VKYSLTEDIPFDVVATAILVEMSHAWLCDAAISSMAAQVVPVVTFVET
jgi:hypothetical protein